MVARVPRPQLQRFGSVRGQDALAPKTPRSEGILPSKKKGKASNDDRSEGILPSKRKGEVVEGWLLTDAEGSKDTAQKVVRSGFASDFAER